MSYNKDKERHQQQNRAWIVANKEKAAKSMRAMRQRTADYVYEQKGQQCCNCGSTERLEWDHINPALIGKNRNFKSMSPTAIKEEIDNLQVLCFHCHLKRSKAQQIAAWKMFISLPLEEQERIVLEYL